MVTIEKIATKKTIIFGRIAINILLNAAASLRYLASFNILNTLNKRIDLIAAIDDAPVINNPRYVGKIDSKSINP